MSEISKVFDECFKFGPVVFTQCSHAIGHGLLANLGYRNLLTALKMCDQVERDIPEFPVYNCHDGVFMENVWGVHDGQPSPNRWVKEDDPIYPCNDPRIDKKYQLACWSNQSSLMFQFFKNDVKKVGQECDKLVQPGFKRNCFNALARQLYSAIDGEAEKVFQLCRLMPAGWVNYCVGISALTYLGVGDTELPFDVCGKMDEAGKEECYRELIGPIKRFFQNTDLCNKIQDETWRNKCKNS